jgi:phosphate-selective porin
MKNTPRCLYALLMAGVLVGGQAAAQAQEGDTTKAKTKKATSKKKAKKKAKKTVATATEQPTETAKLAATDEDDSALDKKFAADTKEKPAKRYFRFEFKQYPAIRIGKWFRMNFRFKLEHDFRTFSPEVSTDEGEVENLKKVRVGIEGYVTKGFEYRVEREIRDDIADLFSLRDRRTLALWRDVFGNWRTFRKTQVRVGQFKIPFGMDQLHGGTEEFVYRSLIGNYLAPGRDLGIMLHGKLFDTRIAYQAGLFRHDGWKAHTKDHERSGERTFAGRLVVQPFGFFKTPGVLKPIKDLELGFAAAENPITEGLRSLRGRTWIITHNWFERIDVRGHRLRLGAELKWEPGPFVVKSEVIRVRDERHGQGLRDDDLPNLIARGWYFTTGWVVTGEKTAGGIVPKRDFIKGRGIGAVQLAARYEQLRFGSSEHPGLPSRSSRAANIYSESERIASFGANWYLNRFVKIQFSALREVLEDVQKAPIPGVDTYWSKFLRIQFSF